MVAPHRRLSQRQRRSIGHGLIHVLMIVVSAACLAPLLIILSASFTDEAALVNDGFRLIPSHFSLYAYQFLLSDPNQI